MFGTMSGLYTVVREICPDITSWHCSPHHLELAVNYSLKEVTSTNYFSIFLSKLHSIFSMSAKDQRQMEHVASNPNEQVIRIGAMITIR